MKTATKKFNCDFHITEFAEVDKTIKKSGKSRREWLLSAARASKNGTENKIEIETLEKLTEKAQEQINAAYKAIIDVYLDAGAALLSTDREKGVELLSKALSLKAPIIDISFEKTK